jgi:hypothetical protein
MMKLFEIIEQNAQAALKQQSVDGAMPPGHNGPWGNIETPVRNTGYWLITFLKCYEIAGDIKYLEAANKAINYLVSDAARPLNFAFWHRKSSRKDANNGLVGQAWTIEALAIASLQLEREDLAKIVEAVFLMHPYDYSTGLWSTLKVNGEPGLPKLTINQQIFFAAAASLITDPKSREIPRRVRHFLSTVHKYIKFNKHGIITHQFQVMGQSYVFGLIDQLRWMKKLITNGQMLKELGIGYHSFNLYGLSILASAYPDLGCWNNKVFQDMWKGIDTEYLQSQAENNPYCYVYNPTGIEVAYAIQTFRPESTDIAEKWLNSQFSRTLDRELNLMNNGNSLDPLTLMARIYEAIRLNNYTITL